MCIVCKKHASPDNFIRIVKTSTGTVAIDTVGKVDGRGAYICKDIECAELAKKRAAIRRALNVAVSDELYDAVIDAVKKSKGD